MTVALDEKNHLETARLKNYILIGALIALNSPVWAEPVDLTGMSCSRPHQFGLQTWEFYGDVAIRYYEDSTLQRFPRIGEGAYEKYDREGKISAVFYFFNVGNGVQMRVLAKPGLIVLDENPTAPLEIGIFNFNGTCIPLWEAEK